MAVHGLDHVNLRASRPLMAALQAFYVEVVGLEPGPRPPFGSEGAWLYAGGHPIVHLSLEHDGQARDPGARPVIDHVAFACSDRAAVEARLAAHGVAFRRAVVPGRGQVQLFLVDPAGNGVELDFADAAS
jgi:catechol-2,3-dioxygenase